MYGDVRKLFIESIMFMVDDLINFYETGGFGKNQLLIKAVNVATALYHLREHLPSQFLMTRSQVESLCSDYGLLGDIVNLSKHHKLDRGNPQISSSSQIIEQIEITNYSDDQGDYFYPQLEIILELDDRSRKYLIDVILSVYEFWYNKFEDFGIAKFSKQIPHIERGYKTRIESEQKQIDFSIISGETFNLNLQIFNWLDNEKTRRPMDLSGHSMELQVRELPESVPITIKIEELNINFDFDIPLNKEQSKHYIKIEKEDDRLIFLNQIIESTDSLKGEINNKITKSIQNR